MLRSTRGPGSTEAPLTLDVVLVSPGLPHQGRSLEQGSLGGSETAAIHVSRALARRGHRVAVFSPGATGEIIDGVTWLPIEQAAVYLQAGDHDVEIVSRALDVLRVLSHARVRVFWCHDLALKRHRGHLGGLLWSLDAVYVMSEFQRQQYVDAGGIPAQALVTTRNGVDLASFEPLRTLPRDPDKLIYGSRPERGLEGALRVMDRLREGGSTAVLHCAWYENTPPQLVPYYEQLFAQAKARPNVHLLGPLKQADWHRELATAQALLYPGCPGDFREISCIAAMEALAAGTPVVACRKGALPETLGANGPECDAGVLLGDETTDVTSRRYLDDFANAVSVLLTVPGQWRAFHEGAYRRGRSLDWSGVAQQWELDWLARLRERATPRPLLAGRWRRSGEAELAEGLG